MSAVQIGDVVYDRMDPLHRTFLAVMVLDHPSIVVACERRQIVHDDRGTGVWFGHVIDAANVAPLSTQLHSHIAQYERDPEMLCDGCLFELGIRAQTCSRCTAELACIITPRSDELDAIAHAESCPLAERQS